MTCSGMLSAQQPSAKMERSFTGHLACRARVPITVEFESG
jgi:hypothetical protein